MSGINSLSFAQFYFIVRTFIIVPIFTVIWEDNTLCKIERPAMSLTVILLFGVPPLQPSTARLSLRYQRNASAEPRQSAMTLAERAIFSLQDSEK